MLSNTYIAVILLSLISVVSTVVGIFLAFFCKENKKKIAIGIGFSAGIVLVISFFELIPESIKSISILNALLTLGFGTFFIFILNYFLSHTHFIEEKGKLIGNLKSLIL